LFYKITLGLFFIHF